MARRAAALLLAACLAVALSSCAAFKAEEFKVRSRSSVCKRWDCRRCAQGEWPTATPPLLPSRPAEVRRLGLLHTTAR